MFFLDHEISSIKLKELGLGETIIYIQSTGSVTLQSHSMCRSVGVGVSHNTFFKVLFKMHFKPILNHVFHLGRLFWEGGDLKMKAP